LRSQREDTGIDTRVGRMVLYLPPRTARGGIAPVTTETRRPANSPPRPTTGGNQRQQYISRCMYSDPRQGVCSGLTARVFLVDIDPVYRYILVMAPEHPTPSSWPCTYSLLWIRYGSPHQPSVGSLVEHPWTLLLYTPCIVAL
jgi:hypothetical protein